MPRHSGGETVTVDLGERSYDIEIGDGALAGIGPFLAETCPGGRAIIVTDDTVNAAHGGRLRTLLERRFDRS